MRKSRFTQILLDIDPNIQLNAEIAHSPHVQMAALIPDSISLSLNAQKALASPSNIAKSAKETLEQYSATKDNQGNKLNISCAGKALAAGIESAWETRHRFPPPFSPSN